MKEFILWAQKEIPVFHGTRRPIVTRILKRAFTLSVATWVQCTNFAVFVSEILEHFKHGVFMGNMLEFSSYLTKKEVTLL